MRRAIVFASLAAVALVACSSSETDLGLGKGAGGSGASSTGDTTTTGTTSGTGTSTVGQGGQGQGGGGTSTCAPGTADCDGAPGCETSVGADVANCGACGVVCGTANAAPTCVNGACTFACDPGWANCDGDPANGCEASLADPKSCGACGVVCQGACLQGKCGGPCDEDAVAIDAPDAALAAKVIGLCDGVVAAKWVQPDGTPEPGWGEQQQDFHRGHGLLPGFGPNVHPQQGTHLLALSTGAARQPIDAGWADEVEKNYQSGAPAGFPKALPACPGVTTGTPNDGVGLELTLTVPQGKTGFSFASAFFSHEWPGYVCSEYADAFLAILAPQPAGLPDANVLFDASGNYINVASSFLDVCGCQNGPPCIGGQPNQAQVSFACSLGTSGLVGTGFDGTQQDPTLHGSTGWLLTTAPAAAGTTVTVRFTTYDSGDGKLDSTALVDDFRWLDAPGVAVGTTRIAAPK